MIIVNPNKKSDLTIRYLHHFQEKFASVIQMHTKIIEEFGSQVPDSVTFNLGCFEGQRHAKMAIVSDDDLTMMYDKYKSGEVTLWCDARTVDEEPVGQKGKKRKHDNIVVSRFHEKEDEVAEIFKELKKQHEDR